VVTLVTPNPIVCVARVSPHHRERFRVRTGAARAWRRRGVNQLRWNRVHGRNETGARVLHDALQSRMCAWVEQSFLSLVAVIKGPASRPFRPAAPLVQLVCPVRQRFPQSRAIRFWRTTASRHSWAPLAASSISSGASNSRSRWTAPLARIANDAGACNCPPALLRVCCAAVGRFDPPSFRSPLRDPFRHGALILPD
jgi:hypothetical protein